MAGVSWALFLSSWPDLDCNIYLLAVMLFCSPALMILGGMIGMYLEFPLNCVHQVGLISTYTMLVAGVSAVALFVLLGLKSVLLPVALIIGVILAFWLRQRAESKAAEYEHHYLEELAKRRGNDRDSP